ncbi:MAG: sigma-70 family RNA polymerase sigma factor [Acidobacteria bacterium]|nr:sigma-70 family RNA polymerase sigma factor [Acidobacteriota bacterium]
MDCYCSAPCLELHSSVRCSGKPCLIRAAAAGEACAQDEMFAKLQPSVLMQARVFCRDRADAEDLAQQCILQAMQRIGQLRDQRKVAAWTWKIVQNEHRMSLRRNKFAPRQVESFDEGRMSPSAACLSDAFRAISFQDLCRLLSKSCADLSGNLRQVLELRIAEAQSTAQAARILGVTEEVVRTRLKRARQALRRSLV